MKMKSILDTDLYLFSVSYLHIKLYPDAEGELVFKDRNNTEYTEDFVEKFKKELADLQYLELTKTELEWCVKKIPYIPRAYWEWLRGFRFNPDLIKISLDEEHHLHITVTDKLYKAGLYEIPILATLSELKHEYDGDKYSVIEQLERIDEKIKISNENGLKFASMAPRRRFSYDIEDLITKRMKETAKYCTGTSNVYLAMKYDMTPIGTMNHFSIAFVASQFGYRMANYKAMENWVDVFDGYLGTYLTDLLTNDIFFKNFSRKHACLFAGIRHDSGDELVFVDKAVKRYHELGIDPMTKTIIFSNALDMPKYKKIAEYCKGKINCSAGIGTNLACDIPGVKPANIVMKLMKARMNEKQEWVNCIKLSDDLGKAMGDPGEVDLAMRTLGLK